MKDREQAEAFAVAWVEAWNRRDVEAVLAHFADGVEFTSPFAAQTVGRVTIHGRARLREHWQEALRRREKLHFTLDHWVWDEERRELAIVFIRDVDGERRRACEMLQFDGDGLVVRGEALHGAAV